MGKTTLLASLSAVCLLGGCTVHRICPPVQGTVVDAVTGQAVEGAKVKIMYWESERSTSTDCHGQFTFGAKYKAFPLFPLNLNLSRVMGCQGLRVEAPGYESAETSGTSPVYPRKPPPDIFVPKWTDRDGRMVAEPIPLKRKSNM